MPPRHSCQLNIRFLITQNKSPESAVGGFAVEFRCVLLEGNRYTSACVWWGWRYNSIHSVLDEGRVTLRKVFRYLLYRKVGDYSALLEVSVEKVSAVLLGI